MKLWVGMWLVMALSAVAAEPVKLVVVAGAGGTLRPGAIAPVHVQVECPSDGESYYGRVAARFHTAFGTSPIVTQDLVLSPGSVKRATLYPWVPVTAQTIEIWYETSGGSVVGEPYTEQVRLLDSIKPVIAAVGAFPASMPSNQAAGDPLFASLILQPNQIPARHEGLEMFDALLLTPTPDAPFQRDQMEALAGWVMRGGVLVLDASSRTDFFRSSGIESLSPFLPSGSHESPIEALGGTVLVAAGDAGSSDVLLELEGVPLVYRKHYGLGYVVAFALDPNTAALKSWDGSPRLWSSIFRDPRMFKQIDPQDLFTVNPFGTVPDGSAYIAETIARQVAPNAPSTGLRLGLVLFLTILYALAVGPGDYFLIKRLGKPKLTWITFPIIVAVFTLAAYGGAKFWIGGELAVRTAHRILAFPQIGRAIHYEADGLFVPQGATYEVSTSSDGLLRHLGEVTARGDRVHHDQSANTLHHRIPIWTYRVYGASDTVSEWPQVDVALDFASATKTLTVTNRTETPLTNLRVHGQWASQLHARLEPGQQTMIPLNRSAIRVHDDQHGSLGPFTLANQYPSMMREFTADDAFTRGAVMLECTAEPMPTTLVVNAQPRAESGPVRLQILLYPEPQEDAPS